jgi:PAS domain S-box-containing protein
MGPFANPDQDAAAAGELVRGEFAQSVLKSIFEVSPDAILVTDSEGMIRGANPCAAVLFGYTEQEFLGKPVEDLVPERFRPRHAIHRENYNAFPRSRRMGVAESLFGLRKDGSEFPVDIMLKPIDSVSGPLVLSFVRDITEIRAAQEELRRTDEQLDVIIDSVREYAIFLLDRDGCVITWNPGAEHITKYKKEEILGCHISRLHGQEDIDRGHAAEIMEMTAARGRVEVEGWRVRKDGSRFWADVLMIAIRDKEGHGTGYAVVTRDFTDRKLAAEGVMLQLTTALLANIEMDKLLEAMGTSIRAVIPHDTVTMALYDPATRDLCTQFLSCDGAKTLRGEVRLSVQGSPCGAAYGARRPILVERISESSFGPEGVRHLTSIGMQSGCWAPLIFHGDAIGAISVSSRLVSGFSQHEMDMLMQVADHVGLAVGNALALQRVSEMRDRLHQEKQYLESQINLENRYEDLVGKSTALLEVLKQIEAVAPTGSTVLIEGETGTGKELLARAIHRLSTRKDASFIKLSCATIPAGLLESELFGHEKGAFTGAIARKLGLLELAQDGTLFLDEVGELPLELQPKLLRALQEREIQRLGSTRSIPVNIRLIAATNRDLSRMVANKEFRDDLYYRLKVFPILAPPLRKREGDIPILVRHFVSVHSKNMGKNIETIPDEAMDALVKSKWPGNIRELENFLERCVILTRGPVLHVPLSELEPAEHGRPALLSDHHTPEDPNLEKAERDHILRVLRQARGCVGGPDGAAARLGLKRSTLYSKLKKLHIELWDDI